MTCRVSSDGPPTRRKGSERTHQHLLGHRPRVVEHARVGLGHPAKAVEVVRRLAGGRGPAIHGEVLHQPGRARRGHSSGTQRTESLLPVVGGPAARPRIRALGLNPCGNLALTPAARRDAMHRQVASLLSTNSPGRLAKLGSALGARRIDIATTGGAEWKHSGPITLTIKDDWGTVRTTARRLRRGHGRGGVSLARVPDDRGRAQATSRDLSGAAATALGDINVYAVTIFKPRRQRARRARRPAQPGRRRDRALTGATTRRAAAATRTSPTTTTGGTPGTIGRSGSSRTSTSRRSARTIRSSTSS